MTALKEKYHSEIVLQLQSELGLKNVMAVPRISKITLNMGVGEAVGDKKVLEHAVSDMRRLQAKSLSSPSRVSRSRASKFAMAGRLVAKSRCATSACMNSLIA